MSDAYRVSSPGSGPAHGLPEGDRAAGGPDRQWLRLGYFPAALSTPRGRPRGDPGFGPFPSRNKIAVLAILHWRFGPALCGCKSGPPAAFVAMKAAMGAAGLPKETIMSDPDDTHFEAQPASSTDHVLQELQLYGYRPFEDEPDPRPLPEGHVIAASIADIFDALVVAMADTRLEPDLEELLWGTVNLFHRACSRIERKLDENEVSQQRLQREQDGSEVKSIELERLTAQGQTLLERRGAFELMRDQAAEHFERHTHSIWRPRSGSVVNHRSLTAAMIDSRDFLAARKHADTHALLPAGPKVAFTGGFDFNDHRLIWAKLDQVHAKHPDMVLLHGGSPKGAELIAAKWAHHRKVPQIAFKPDWTRHAKAAPFKRNDAMLDTLPIGVIHFPGTGIQDNLADKARQLGIPVMKFGGA